MDSDYTFVHEGNDNVWLNLKSRWAKKGIISKQKRIYFCPHSAYGLFLPSRIINALHVNIGEKKFKWNKDEKEKKKEQDQIFYKYK